MSNWKEKLQKKGVTNGNIVMLVATAIIAMAMVVIALCLKVTQVSQMSKMQGIVTAENLRASNYTQITDENAKVENCDYVLFSAFFTRDLDLDGNAEKLLGTCKEINEPDQLYIDLNVLSNGYLENGKITINGTNFNYAMNMVKDNVLKNTYISNNVKEIELNKIEAGTQKLIIGNVVANLGNNINNYTAGISLDDLNNISKELQPQQVNTITLTGTHVADDGTKTEISKTIPVTIDWYGTARTELFTQNSTYYYNDINSNTISINIELRETYKKLILSENVANLTIPDLNGFAPVEVKCINSNVESQYNAETKVLSLKRKSKVDENGKVITTLSNSNKYSIEITYPQEAYDTLQSYTTITIPVVGYYTGYNNQNEEFENPYKTNIAKGQVTVLFRDKPQGNIYNFYTYYDNKKYVEDPYYKYVISKQNLINLYNKQELDEQTPNEEITVKWIATRGGIGEVPSMIMSETREENEKYGDKFSDIVMDDYILNTGIYFENADGMLGETGEIKIYDNDTNELIKTFTAKDWNIYTKQNPYKYETPVKHIRVETSKANINSTLVVYNIKELQTVKFVQNYTLEQLKQMNTVYTYMTGVCNIEGQESGIRNVLDYAEFIEEKSMATISVSKNQLEAQETTQNQQITITARCNNIGDSKWKNANYIVEIPKEIINMEINGVYITNSNVELIGYELYKENDQYLIKILTENEEPEAYEINIKCNMTPDPRKPTSHRNIKLYASNEWDNEYYYQSQDVYDVNGNNDTEEIVGENNTEIDLLSPTSLITLETVSNYNDVQEITVAPNIADVDKQTREATINLELTNNYTTAVSGIQILGKIPYQGNTYILNGNSMNSQFTTIMKNTGIQIPQELQEKTVVYYSTNENPGKDITDPANGWTLLKNVEDFSKIRSYLIDMKEYVLEIGKQYNFKYVVGIPEGVEYNKVSYSNHAVFYELDTDGGMLAVSTEPNKIGIRIARKFDLEVIKNKSGMEKVVSGATYKLIQIDENREEITSKICTTDENGKMIFKDLYINAKYIFKEVRESSNYSLNDDIVEFETSENANGELVINVISQDKFKTEPIVTKDAKGRDVVKTTVEDEPKYSIEITKTDIATGEKLGNVQFEIAETGSIYRTDSNGKVTIEKLEQNVTYTLKEIKAEGYYLLEDIQFKLIKDAQGKFKIESQNLNFVNATIENTEENDLIKISLGISNEKIPTYKLQILKVEENADEQEIDKLKPLQGAIFKLKYKDLEKEKNIVTDENGNIDISDLYQYVDGKYITGKYTLQELQSPEGYANNGEEINFRVTKNTENNLEIEIENKDSLKTVKNTIVDGNTVKLIIQNKPLFKIIKTDSDTGNPIANVKFVIYECNENYSPVDFAKDSNGNYVGQKDEKDRYIITTDEKGEITIPLREAKYKIEEVDPSEEYSKSNYWKFFEIGENKNSGVNEEGDIEVYELEKKYQDIVDNVEKGDDELEVALEIDSIEDLVRFSNDVNSGYSYENKMIKLMKTLDFEDDNSYENPNSKVFGDLNGNGVIETLKEELTNKDGFGFTPIGTERYGNFFKGTFDGQRNEIRNIYINKGNYYYTGLFGIVYGKVKNLGITGEIIGKYDTAGIVGQGCGETVIFNCYNKCNVTTDSYGSGIGMRCYSIINCYNTGNIIGDDDAGGISCNTNGYIINCYNTGNVKSNGYMAGGIEGSYGVGDVVNCSNMGEVTGNARTVGISSNTTANHCYNKGKVTSISGDARGICMYGTAINCINEGDITGGRTASGITEMYAHSCYNSGNITSESTAFGIGGNEQTKCYNTGNVTSTKEIACGISRGGTSNCYNTGNIKGYTAAFGIGYGSQIKYCYNTGNVISDTKASGIGPGGDTNSYCLDTAQITAPQIIQSTMVSDEYMKSTEFFNIMNSYDDKDVQGNSIWKHQNNQYPQLVINVGKEIKEVTELNIKNTINKYKITTDVEEVNGVKGGTITGEDEEPYETVNYGKDNTKEIKMVPDENYVIVQITINGEILDFTENEDGSYTIPAGYFTKMKENKHIVVKYMLKQAKLTINKVDKFDSGRKLEGAKFSIEQIEEKYKVQNQIGEAVNNGTKQTVPDLTEEVTGVIKEINNDETYYFEEISGKYIPNNKNIDKSTAKSCIKIDLTNKEGKYTVQVNANISSEKRCDIGYAMVNASETSLDYTSEGFINISGDIADTDYYSQILEGGNIYYLHIGYRKDANTNSGNDQFIVNSVKVFKAINEVQLGFEKQADGKYISDNKGKYSTVASSYIPIDLTGWRGKYTLTVNATISSESYEYGYATITDSNNQGKVRLINISGNVNAKDYTTVLGGGKLYYLHIGYKKDSSTSSKDDIFTINSISLKLNNTEVQTNDLGQAFIELPFGKYKITETEAPNGYKLNSEPIIYEMKENEENILTIENSPNTDEYYDMVINKVEKITNTPIANTKFVVYELDKDRNIIGFARGTDWNYIGEFVRNEDEQGNWVVTTDEDGKIRLKLKPGSYKAVEIESAPGYVLEDDEDLRTIYFNVGEIQINYIEDLLDLSNNVTNGNSYYRSIITMNRSLDFNDDSSYRNPNDTTTYGDYNLDGQVEGIKAELTNKNGVGFHPIGKETNSKEEGKAFSGTFDGNGYEIKNLYINSEYSTLFSNITSGNVCNLKLSDVSICDKGNGSYGLGYNVKDSNISNCSISGKVSSENSGAAGLAFSVENSTISNCYNTGEISANVPAAGLAFSVENSTISNCYNTGEISANAPAAGLAYYFKNSTISNCYNTGKITSLSSTAGGLVASIYGGTITNSYNTGEITSLSAPVGGLTFSIENATIINCYNTGTVVGNYCIAGIATQVYENSSIENCYNTGELKPCETSTQLNYGAILFSNDGGDTSTIKNTYYLNTTATQGIYGKDDEIGKTEAKTLEEMQSQEFTNILNNNKKTMTDSDKLSNWVYVKNGVPTLQISNSNNLITERTGKNITIINEKQSKIIVHHYLEGTGPEYNNEPIVLAEDEVIMGAVDDKYITSPKMDIPNYELIKNENGEYVIPSNASGNFTENEQHVYYYYNVEPVKLIVHHYLEGTEDKLAEDEQYFYQKGDHYKVTPSEEVLKTYDFVSVVGTEEDDITEDEIVTYYYKLKQYKITTRVEIPEVELEAGRTEKGGTISGEDEQPYEIVKHGENSKNPLIIIPDAGYKVNTITINGSQAQFTVKPDGTVELPKFENMTEDKEIVVSFVPAIGKVITHHYIQGTTEKLHDDIINEDKVGSTVKTEPVNIDNYKLVGSEGNKDADGNVIITKEISEGVEEIIYYYQVCYKITTDVIEHTENYKDGTVKENVKGGTITDEDVVIHEQVMKYEDNVKIIEIKPDNEYEIEEVLVNGKPYDFTSKLDGNGNVILPAGTFTNVQENIHVEVKFRRKSKVIVKYLEEGTQTELAPKTVISGFEGKEFNTIAEIIPSYNLVKIPASSGAGTESVPKVTDENNNLTNPSGTMFSDDLTIIYWYTKLDANIIVRHIETNEKGEEIEIENELRKDSVGANVTTNRKEYDKFISVDAPEETKEKIENNYPNITIVGKDDNSKTITVIDGETLEVWYYYEKQYNITTEVKTHKEIINGVETQVAGGTISKEYKLDENGEKVEVTYEVVNSRGDSTKAIEMVPEVGYRVKTITVNGKEILINNISKDDLAVLGIVKDGEKVTLKEGYFKDVQNDYHVVVEFEKIPAKVIVKYLDDYTKESIIEDKIVEGHLYDEYNEQRVDIEGYIPSNPEPNNSTGKMTVEPITVIYYYTKQFKITTDVKEHLEDEIKSIVDVVIDKFDETTKEENSSTGGTVEEPDKIPEGKILVKGGTIAGEDEQPYETVLREKENKKQIEIIPNEGYRIKSLTIIDLGKEYKLSIENMINENGNIILPSAYFTNMQSDKHIVVEFELIPAKVIVNYLDIDTKEDETPTKVSKTENGNGYVNYDYKTYAKNIPFYELVKEELPKNAEGKLTKEDTVVNYWYKKLLFNMKLTKQISSIKVNGEEVLKEDNKFAKIDIPNTKVADTNIIVKYKISVTNTEKVSGIATIVEQIPVGFKYVKTTEEDINNVQNTEKWQEIDGKLQLTTRDLRPGETAEYEIELQWNKNMNCIGNLVNTAKITRTDNIPGFKETTLEDNVDSCTVILAIKTGENRDIKTIISISCFILAGICTVIYVVTEVITRRKE